MARKTSERYQSMITFSYNIRDNHDYDYRNHHCATVLIFLVVDKKLNTASIFWQMNSWDATQTWNLEKYFGNIPLLDALGRAERMRQHTIKWLNNQTTSDIVKFARERGNHRLFAQTA